MPYQTNKHRTVMLILVVIVAMVTRVLLSKPPLAYGQILPSSSYGQGTFSWSLFSPTDSCYRFVPAKLTLVYCGQGCLRYSERTYLFGINHSTGQCACCDYPISRKVQSTNWVSYERCPIGYTEVRWKTTKFCFQLFWTPEFYSVACRICQESTNQASPHENATSELVRLDSLEKLYALEYFLQNLKAPGDVWVQGVKDEDNVWRFEDGSIMSDVCPREFSNKLDEFNMRFKTYLMRCSDRSASRFSFVCEAYV